MMPKLKNTNVVPFALHKKDSSPQESINPFWRTIPPKNPGYDDKNGKRLNDLTRKASPRTSSPCRYDPTAPGRPSQPLARANSDAPVSGCERRTDIVAIPCRGRSRHGNKARIRGHAVATPCDLLHLPGWDQALAGAR